MLASWWERFGVLWCGWMHSGTTWPVNGHYECKQCLRRYPVAWESVQTAAEGNLELQAELNLSGNANTKFA